MLVEHLSDHAGKLLQESRRELLSRVREKEYWEQQLWAADDERRAAQRARPLLGRLLGRPSHAELEANERFEFSRQQLDQTDHLRRLLEIRVDQQTTGTRGEERLESALKWLSDDWAMFRGYRNGGGEADHILIGPGGIWAIEVKASKIRLHVDGERWWHETVDRKGRVLSESVASDRSGRTWARQVGDVATGLERRLHKRGFAVRVRTAVVLMHPRAQLGDISKPGVDFIGTDPRRLMQEVADHAVTLDHDELATIVGLVRDDHRFHQNRHRNRRAKMRNRHSQHPVFRKAAG